MFAYTNRILWLLVLGILAVAVASGCSGIVDSHPAPAVEQPATSRPLPNQPPQPCSSGEFALPDSLAASGRTLGLREYASIAGKEHPEQYDWLSVQIALMQNNFGYADPLTFQLVVSNETNHPVIFCRPSIVSLLGHFPAELEVILKSSSGERFGTSGSLRQYLLIGVYPLQRDFTVLPPGSSCSEDLQLKWDSAPEGLPEPIPAGDYSMSVIFKGLHSGFWTQQGSKEYVDMDAWVGITGPSNSVTLTIKPPD